MRNKRDTYKPADDSFKYQFVEDYNKWVTEWNLVEAGNDRYQDVDNPHQIQVYPQSRMLIVSYDKYDIKLKFNNPFFVYHDGWSFMMHEMDVTNIKAISIKKTDP